MKVWPTYHPLSILHSYVLTPKGAVTSCSSWFTDNSETPLFFEQSSKHWTKTKQQQPDQKKISLSSHFSIVFDRLIVV